MFFKSFAWVAYASQNQIHLLFVIRASKEYAKTFCTVTSCNAFRDRTLKNPFLLVRYVLEKLKFISRSTPLDWVLEIVFYAHIRARALDKNIKKMVCNISTPAFVNKDRSKKQ